MKRFQVQARVYGSKKKYLPLYKEEKKHKGIFKTWGGADRHIEKMDQFYPGIQFRVQEINLTTCPTCGQVEQ